MPVLVFGMRSWFARHLLLFFSFLPCPLPCQRGLVCRIADHDAMISVSQPQPAPIPVGPRPVLAALLVRCHAPAPKAPAARPRTRHSGAGPCALCMHFFLGLDAGLRWQGTRIPFRHIGNIERATCGGRMHVNRPRRWRGRGTTVGPLTDALVEHPLGLVCAAFLEHPACFCASGAAVVPGWA